jgi:hypothetical protein
LAGLKRTSTRPITRSELSTESAIRKKLFAPGWFGCGISERIEAA